MIPKVTSKGYLFSEKQVKIIIKDLKRKNFLDLQEILYEEQLDNLENKIANYQRMIAEYDTVINTMRDKSKTKDELINSYKDEVELKNNKIKKMKFKESIFGGSFLVILIILIMI